MSPSAPQDDRAASRGRARDAGLVRLAEKVVRQGDVLSSRLEPIGEREPVASVLRRNLARHPDSAAYRVRGADHFVDVTWRELLSRVAALGSFLRAQGVGAGDRVAVLSRNRAEMLLSEFATMSVGAVHLPIFAGYSGEQSRALLADSGAVTVVLSDGAQLAKLRPADPIRLVVHFDPVEDRVASEATAGYRGAFLSLEQALRAGGGAVGDGAAGAPDADAFLRSCEAVDPGTPCLMMYTSGTSREQKGVVLTHDNILSQRRAIARIWTITPADRFLSYLPWHHSFGGIFEKFTAIYHAAPIAVDESQGKDFPLLLRNWKEIRPTVYFSVPIVYQRLVDHVRLHPEEEDEIFHPELKFVFTAAAPLPASISAYFAAKGIPVLEGWGLTETSPCCTLTDPAEPRAVPGVVGYPIPGVRIQLAADGEILVQGPNVMVGYHGNQAATRDVLPGDGWFRTGDVGEIVGSALRLVARKDRIFKLLNGERVVPTPLENWLAGRSRYILHAVVAGSGRDSLSVLLFPNLPLIEMEFGTDRETAERVVRESFRDAILELNREHPIKYEAIQAYAVISRELTVEGNELTPSMKVRFANVLRNYEKFIEAIYEPSRDCDCRFLRRIVRVPPDERRCFRGKDVTLDRCHECSLLSSPDTEGR